MNRFSPFLARAFSHRLGLLLFLGLSLGCGAGVRAQAVFRMEREHAQSILRQTRSNFACQHLARFELAALNYLEAQLVQFDEAERNKWLDHQAYHLADFLSLYHLQLADENLSDEEHEKLKDLFARSSLHAPLLGDDDETRTLIFVGAHRQGFTPFSLDTDWAKALQRTLSALQDTPQAYLVEQFKARAKKRSMQQKPCAPIE